MKPPSDLRTRDGRRIHLGQVLGQGGEGAVFALKDDSGKAAKIYSPAKAQERQEKVELMCSAGWHRSAPFAAFPIDALYRSDNTFVGFTMKKAGKGKLIHQLYSPTDRKSAFPKASFPFLVRTCLNIAAAIASVHSNGCIIGDINHSGVLVADDATVTLIDTDSFQVAQGGRLYPCVVGVKEFTPPELQGQNLGQTVRTEAHDNFGLAVLVFHLLMMGRHPFAGRYAGKGDMPIERAIAELRFAYSARTNEMSPPPNVPILTDLPSGLRNAFEQAFGPSGINGVRPTAAQWVGLLEQAEGEIIACKQGDHHYFREARQCPWCAMEAAYPGFIAFPPPLVLANSTGVVQLSQLIDALRSIPDPGPAPEIDALLPQEAPSDPSSEAKQARKTVSLRYAAVVAFILIGISFFQGSVGHPFWGIGSFIVSAFLAFRPSAVHERLLRARSSAEKDWSNAKEAWEKAASNERFRSLRAQADKLVTEIQALPGREARQLHELEQRRRELQLHRFLERHPIRSGKIRYVGASRVITLKSWGIETAADIDGKIYAIPGFGHTIVSSLYAWRGAVEAKFVFNPNEPVNPADISAVKSDIQRQRRDLVGRLQTTIQTVQRTAAEAKALRSVLPGSLTATWLRYRQAEADMSALKGLASRFVGLGIVGLVAVMFLSRADAPSSHPHVSRFERSSTRSVRPEPKPDLHTKLPPVAPVLPREPRGATVRPQSTFEIKKPEPPANTVALPPRTESAAAPNSYPLESAEHDTSRGVELAPPLPPPVEVAPVQIASTSDNVMDLEDPVDLALIQNRLIQLGYLRGLPSFTADDRVLTALRIFRTTANLPQDGAWDFAAQTALFAEDAPQAPPPPTVTRNVIFGSWSPMVSACRHPSLVITPNSLEVKGVRCAITSITPTRHGANIAGTCISGKNFSGRLTVSGRTLTWPHMGETGKFFRCR